MARRVGRDGDSGQQEPGSGLELGWMMARLRLLRGVVKVPRMFGCGGDYECGYGVCGELRPVSKRMLMLLLMLRRPARSWRLLLRWRGHSGRSELRR